MRPMLEVAEEQIKELQAEISALKDEALNLQHEIDEVSKGEFANII